MNDKKMEDFTTISIPTSLAVKIEGRLKEAGFDSVSAYVAYVLNEVVGEDEPVVDENEAFSEEEEEIVNKRLKALGYLD